MNALQRFEAWVSQVIEGGLVGLLGAEVQPVDLAKRLGDYMDDHRAIGAGRVYVPNVYRVYLAPPTLASFAAFAQALEAELAAYLAARAAERDNHSLGRFHVTLLADAGLGRRRFRVEGDLVDRATMDSAAGGEMTRPIAAAPPATMGPNLVVVVGRRTLALNGTQAMTLGRALDNDLILDDTAVSRHHARLVPRVGYWLLEDLGSTHGCYLNNRRVSAVPVRAGDRLRLGATELRIEGRSEVRPR